MITLIQFFNWPIFRRLHEWMRKCLVWSSRTLLKIACFNIKADFRWVVRHSASKLGTFNIFLSDIDYSLIVPTEELKAAGNIKQRYFWCKKLFPWLGELEVYSEAEALQLQDLMSQWGAIYLRIRQFRKFNWMTLALNSNPTPLSKLKLQRAALICLNNLGTPDAQSAIEQLIAFQELPKFDFLEPVFFPYLGCWINSKSDTGPYPSYRLPGDKIPQLLTQLPTTGIQDMAPLAIINEWHLDPKFSAQAAALLKIEAIIVRAVNRGSPVLKAEMQEWENSLWRTDFA